MANEELKEQNIERVLQTAYECYLSHGIDYVTKEMLAKESGVSRASLSRYFRNKADCVIQTAEWIGKNIREIRPINASTFSSGNYSGADLLRRYMETAKELYLKNPRVFVLRAEFKAYIYRYGGDIDHANERLTDALGSKALMREIFERGVSDGSFPTDTELDSESAYFCEVFLGFLSNMAMGSDNSGDYGCKHIDHCIVRIMKQYQQH